MGLFMDLLGTTRAYLRIGFGGPRLKASGANLIVRNATDAADAEVTAAKVNVSGEVLVINSDSAGAGADWNLSLQRPTSGMTADVVLTLPPTDGTPGQVLGTDGDGILDWVSAGSTAHLDAVDATTLAFDDTSPRAMFTLPANAVIDKIQVVVETAFDSTPTMSVGVSGTVSKFAVATDVDLTAPAGTTFELHPGVPAEGGTQDLILTYAAAAASVGNANVLVFYSIPT